MRQRRRARPFVAERAVYIGAGFRGRPRQRRHRVDGHDRHAGQRPRLRAASPPPPPPPASFSLTSVSPSAGRLGGGQTIHAHAASGFKSGRARLLRQPAWTGDRNGNTVLPDVDEATNVVVGNGGTTITAKTPARGFYTGYQTAGPVTVRVVNPTTRPSNLVQRLHLQVQRARIRRRLRLRHARWWRPRRRPFPDWLRSLLATTRRWDPATERRPADRAAIRGYVSVTNGGVVGECAGGGRQLRRDGRLHPLPHRWQTASASPTPTTRWCCSKASMTCGRGRSWTNARNALRTIIISARDRGIVPVVTRLTGTSTNLISSGSLTTLADEIWALTEESLGLEIYRQSLDEHPIGRRLSDARRVRRDRATGVRARSRGSSRCSRCDGRSDKPGHGCPFAP